MTIEVSKALHDKLLTESPTDDSRLRALIEEKTAIANP